MQVPADVIIQLNESGKWIISNVFTHNIIAVTEKTLELLEIINQTKTEDEIIKKFLNTNFIIWDIEIFSNYEGLFADPTRIIRNNNEWPNFISLEIKEIIKILIKKNIIVRDEEKYNEIFKPKISLLDKEHLGNFHQQLGQHLLIEKRENPDEWWVNQKFSKDLKNLNENLYKHIQESFLKLFFKQKFNEKHFVIDMGCGIGLYTKMMGENGAKILGIDPNEKYIEFAKKEKGNNVDFKISEIGEKGNLDWIESNSVDFIFMSDALLFYFVSPDPSEKPILDELFSSINRILKPNGRFFSMEPHGNFFLKPWMGETERPFTIMTEYRNKKFRIVPNISEIFQAFIKGKFAIRDFKEIYVDEKFEGMNKREINFAKEFPLWWFFELEPIK
jgi:SAM-dependent methyltransferase